MYNIDTGKNLGNSNISNDISGLSETNMYYVSCTLKCHMCEIRNKDLFI